MTTARTDAPERIQLLQVRVGDRTHAVEAGHVAGVVDLPAETPVPHTDPAVVGVVRLREDVSVLLDTHLLVGADRPTDRPPRAVVLESGPDERPVALRVDAAEGLERVHVDRLRPVDQTDLDPDVFAGAVGEGADRFGLLGVERLAEVARTRDR